MEILGISASGRPEGTVQEAVLAVLEATGRPYDFLSLSGKTILGCQGCVGCGATNRCALQDDWTEIGEKMLAADAIVFGAPNYYASINALGHACLERTFCFRHREAFKLAGTLGVAVGVGAGPDRSPVVDFIRKAFTSNLMPLVGTVTAMGQTQCYTCGFGEDCAAGGVVARHGFVECIDPDILPPRFAAQPDAVLQAKKVGKMLGSILREREGLSS